MAKRVKKMRMELEADPVAGTYKIKRCFYDCDDDAVADVMYTNLTGPNPCPGRDVTGDELSGTLQAFFNSVKAEIEGQESIDG